MFLTWDQTEIKLQGEKVSNLAYVPNLTLSVRFGHKNYDQRFSNSSCAKSKYKLKSYFQHTIKHDDNYNYKK